MKRDYTNLPVAEVTELESTSFAPDIYPYPYPRYPVHGGYTNNNHQLMGIVTWLLAMALLVALIRLVWRKGDK